MTAVVVPGEFDVELVSGRYLDVRNPDHHAITLDDIAIPLAKTCRYGGSCAGFFSVAEHAVLVARKLRRLGASLPLQFAGLHHDDAEFCLSDIQRPVKLALRSMSTVDPDRELTKRLDRAIWRALAWPDKSRPPLWTTELLHDPLVAEVDRWACAFEARHIMPSRGEGWGNVWLEQEHQIRDHQADRLYGLEWEAAARLYVTEHRRLLMFAEAAA